MELYIWIQRLKWLTDQGTLYIWIQRLKWLTDHGTTYMDSKAKIPDRSWKYKYGFKV
jgi:hypothetical protein